jgi:hypothetical protein
VKGRTIADSWLGHYVTRQKAAGSISDKVIGFSPPPTPNLHNHSSCTVAMGSTQTLTKMITGNLPGVNGSQRIRLTTSPPSLSQLSWKIWDLQAFCGGQNM